MKLQIPIFSALRVLVIGDIMLDRYWSGATSRISPEAPVPVVHVQNTEERPGGAGNVALNIAALGAQVDLIGFCGNDEAAGILKNKLDQAGVQCYLQHLPDVPTITKLRILSLHQQLIRLDFEDKTDLLDDEKLMQIVEERLRHADIVILSDYAKGCLAHAQKIIQCAQAVNKPVFVDPKTKNFSLYQGATVLTPNRREFEAAVGACESEAHLIQQGEKLLYDCDLKALLITRGEQGMTLLQKNHPEIYLPAFAKQVYDVTGAGDTAIACFALSYLGTHGDFVQASQLANIAASIVVGKLGTATVSPAELRRAIQIQQLSFHRGIVSESELKVLVEDAKAHGEHIVMTGGCFDILHAGHVAYLEQAKRLGARLIVAVNDDASVRQLKGQGRPINNLQQRMNVLAGLSAVDWVVSFKDATPERLINMIQPDIWVKAKDYHIHNLPEAAIVKAYGGQVKLLDLVDGCSTSNIIHAIKEKTT